MTRSILLIPSAEWRDRLLREGPCGAKPPVAHRWAIQNVAASTPWEAGWPSSGGEIALVLVWKGTVVPEGVERAARCLAELERLPARARFCCGVWGGSWTFAVSWRRHDGHNRAVIYVPWPVEKPCQRPDQDVHVLPVLEPLWGDRDDEDVHEAEALATVCAARGLGEAVTL